MHLVYSVENILLDSKLTCGLPQNLIMPITLCIQDTSSNVRNVNKIFKKKLGSEGNVGQV